jgi:chromosome segregation ATPase
MAKKKKRSLSKEQRSLEDLISKSEIIRKNIDTILSAFKRIEKHISEMQKNLGERRVRQQSMNSRLEELRKNIKELDERMNQDGSI